MHGLVEESDNPCCNSFPPLVWARWLLINRWWLPTTIIHHVPTARIDVTDTRLTDLQTTDNKQGQLYRLPLF